jgi:phage baseplate assembly protein W
MHSLLFESLGFVTKEVMKTTIINTLSKFEPRATILDVVLSDDSDNNSVTLDITFRLKNTVKPVTFTTIVDRVR